jgi:CDP-glycerol glycerophosphotransferase (TagB/SpsB family)
MLQAENIKNTIIEPIISNVRLVREKGMPMLKVIKKKLKNYVLKHEINKITINDNNELSVTFNQLNPLFFINRYLVIKSRKTGRRIEKVIKGNEATLHLKELYEICESGQFDIYKKVYWFKKRFLKRSSYNKKIKLLEYTDKKEKAKIKIYKTVKNNLSLKITKILFEHKLNELKAVGQNIYLSGTFQLFGSAAPQTCEIILRRRDNKQSYGFKFEINQSGENVYQYNGIIFLEKLHKDLVINSRWDISIQLRDEQNNVIHREVINLRNFKDFKREEERYLLNIVDRQNNIVSLYATMGVQSLALWYTDKDQFHKTYNIAIGKSVFNETCENEPLDEKMVFFESFFGKNYSGNPKYIYEEMLRDPQFKDFKFVWSYTGNNPESIPGNPIIVNRETEDYYRYLARAKYWVNNIVFPVHRKREGNVYIQTWHGTPLKKLGFDIEIEGPETLARENFYIESRNWDYLISANEYSTKIFRRAFKFDKEVLEVGYPLNDIFYRDDLEQKIKEIKQKLNIPLDKKVILYAPTWRDNEMVGSWKHTFTLKFDLEEFYQNLKDDYVIILRMHHLIADSLQIDDKYKSFVYELSKYDDIQELYVISDIIITDYSSVFFDFANSKRPMLFFAYDFEIYKNDIRGFYLDMEQDLPGPIVKTGEELLDAIKNIDRISEQYKEKYEEFYNKYCYLDDGNAAKRVIERVFGNEA